VRSEVKYDEFLNDATCRPRACGGEPFPVNFREAWTSSCPCRNGMSMYVAGKDGPPVSDTCEQPFLLFVLSGPSKDFDLRFDPCDFGYARLHRLLFLK